MSEQPLLRVIRGGEPTAEELAALVVAVTARAGTAQMATTSPSAWANRSAALRRPLPHGVGAWRLSARPGAR